MRFSLFLVLLSALMLPTPAAQAEVTSTVVIASFYGERFDGRQTASGERFNMNQLTAAHKTLPFGTRVRVTDQKTKKSVVVRINDRGPYAHGRGIDLSRAAAAEIGLIRRGHGPVLLERLT